jgi:hypothetical protein
MSTRRLAINSILVVFCSVVCSVGASYAQGPSHAQSNRTPHKLPSQSLQSSSYLSVHSALDGGSETSQAAATQAVAPQVISPQATNLQVPRRIHKIGIPGLFHIDVN